MLFWLPVIRRCQSHPLITLRPYKPDNSTRAKKVRRSFIFLPTHTTDIVNDTYPPSHQIRFRRYYIIHDLPFVGCTFILQKPTNRSFSSTWTSSLSILYADLTVYNVVSPSFQIQVSSLSALFSVHPKDASFGKTKR